MPRASQEELARRLEEARSVIETGGRYTHYKDPSKEYVVTSLAILEATEEVAVIYEAQYGEHLSFVRLLSVWMESVILPSGERVPRFKKR